MKKERSTNIEILRIICMLLIVTCHIGHSGLVFNQVSINQVLYKLIAGNSGIALNIYILISGYYLINSHKVRPSKLIKLWLQLVFYSVGIYIVFVTLGLSNFSLKSLIEAFLPVSFNQWWFASTYIVLYLFHPFINKFLKSMSKEEYKKFIILEIIVFSLLRLFTLQEVQYNNLILFIMIYSIGGYVKIYEDETIFNKKMFVIILTCFIFAFISSEVLTIFGTNSINKLGQIITSMNSPIVIIISILIFLAFKNISMKNNKIINSIASATFGVYLIHDNNYVRDFLWHRLFRFDLIVNDNWFIVKVLLVVVSIYTLCTAIEITRKFIIEKRYVNYLNKLDKKELIIMCEK